MNANIAISEVLALVGVLPSAALAVGTALTNAINTNLHRRVMFVLDAGTPGGGGTLALSVVASPTAAGTYVPVAGAAAVALSATGQAIVEVRADTLAGQGLGPWIKGQVVVAGATSPASVLALGGVERYLPGSDWSITTAATPVSV